MKSNVILSLIFFCFLAESSAHASCSSSLESILVIDGVSSGKRLPKAIRDMGLKVVGYFTPPKETPAFKASFKPEDYDPLFYRDDIKPEDLVAHLQKLGIAAVIPGSETGVPFADLIAERLRLHGNGLSRSADRGDKYLMNQALHQYGIRAAKQFLSSNVNDMIEWKKKHFPDKAVVIKPLNSAGADNVSFCKTEDEIRTAYAAIIGKSTNMLGRATSAEVVVQEKIEGTVYIVETLSAHGNHFHMYDFEYDTVAISPTRVIQETSKLLPMGHPHEKILFDYAKDVLTALEVKFGASHIEIAITPEGEPMLIEINPRMAGVDIPFLLKEATGFDEIYWTILSYLRPDEVIKKFNRDRNDEILYQIALTNLVPGKIFNTAPLAEIKAMPSFVASGLHFKDGEPLPVTTNLSNTIGDFGLKHRDPIVLEKDYLRILELRNTGAFFQP